jgi:cell division protein FtsQ
MSLDSTLRAGRPSGSRAAASRRGRRRLPHPPARVLIAAVLMLAAFAGGWLWLRDASLVAVRDVEITGSNSSEARSIRAALESAALDMTTLHVREEALRAAVAPYASVADLRIHTDFPHRMAIEVIEHRPVAALVSGGRRLPAAGSGLVLDGVAAGHDLPAIHVDVPPTGGRVTDPGTRAALSIAAAAPAPLRRRVEEIWNGPDGMMLSLQDGPELIFGDGAAAGRKWAAAARVLAEPSAAGATYLDLRVPERVAAGGLGPVPREDPSEEPTPDPMTPPTTNPQP